MGREIPNSLGWEPETVEQYTKRLEGIVKNWHETHTTMSYALKQLLKKYEEVALYRIDNTLPYTILTELKEIVYDI